MRKTLLTACAATLLGGLASCVTSSFALPTEIVSLDAEYFPSNNDSDSPSISSDGRYVAFHSSASDLVADDTNNLTDVFVHDRTTHQTERITTGIADGGGNSENPSISGDGRYVVFESLSSNLIVGDNNGVPDIFLYDRTTNQTKRVSVKSDGTEADDASYKPSISTDGEYVVFYSDATNLVASDNNANSDVFVHAIATGQTERVSIATDGTEGNGNSNEAVISSDGRYVAFESSASNFTGADVNGTQDIFVHDRTTHQTIRVNVATDDTEANNLSSSPSISGDGRYVAFQSSANNLDGADGNGSIDVFVRDLTAGTTTRVSEKSDGTEGNNDSGYPSISGDGRYVAFYSVSSNLLDIDANGFNPDVFVHDMTTHETTLAHVATDGTQGNISAIDPAISSDGFYVTFSSGSTNLSAGDTNDRNDIFVHQYKATAPSGPTIPSLSEWGMIIMAALMTLSALAMRKRGQCTL